MSKQLSPDKGRYLFDGGLNTKFERTIIEDNESPDCLNVEFSNGAVQTRDGFIKFNATTIASFVVDGIYSRHSNTGSETMVVFAGGSAWELTGTSTFVTIGSAQSVFTAGIRVAAAEYQQHMFVGNGGIIPYKYNGSAWTRHGVYPPTTTSAVSTGAAGALTGDYRYKVTYVNSQSVESDVGPVTATHTAAATQISMTAVPTAPQSFGVSARRIYRTTAGGTTYKLLTTISDNTTTTYLDNTADASLGATAPTDNGVPPYYSVIAYHRDRLFCNDSANPSYLWYSNLTEPYTFGAANFRRFGDNTDDLIRAIAVDGENLVVFGDKGIEILYMPDTDDTNWVRVRVKGEFGCKSPFGIVRYKNGLLFPAVQNDKFVGFAHLVGDAIAPSATFLTVSTAGSELVSDKIEPDMFDVAEANISEISGIVFKNKAHFAVPYGDNPTENNRIYLFDFSISNLSRKTAFSWAPWTGLYAAQFVEYSGSLYFGDGRSNGQIWKQNVGIYSDSGTAIDSYYWTKEYGGQPGDFNFHKDFRYANILVERSGAYYMNFTARVDSDTGSGNTQTVDLDPGGSLWGTLEWGLGAWGGGSASREVRVDLGTLSGKRIQFKFDNQNTAGQKFKVAGLNFLSNKKGFR